MTAIVELITQNVETTLKGLSEANGYANTLEVERAKRLGNTPSTAGEGNVKCVVHRGAWRPAGNDNTPCGHNSRFQRYDLVLYPFDKEGDEIQGDERMSTLEGEMEKVLMEDYTRGGYAVNTIVLGATPYPPAPELVAALVFSVEVLYRTVYDNPLEQ